MIKKISRYLFAGGLGAGINFVIYLILLKGFQVWYLLASIIAFCLALIAGFYLQKYWTFKNTSKVNIKKQVFLYLALSLINLGINVLLMLLFVETFNLDKILAKVFSLGALALWSYFIYQKLIFKNESIHSQI